MKFLPLIFANLFRKKLRTTLTIGSFAVALFLFGLLIVVRGAFNQGVDIAGADRLIVINKVSLIMPLPFSYRDRFLQIPGVKYVTYDTWFGGVYQEEKNFFPQFAIDPENQSLVFPESPFHQINGKLSCRTAPAPSPAPARQSASAGRWAIASP